MNTLRSNPSLSNNTVSTTVSTNVGPSIMEGLIVIVARNNKHLTQRAVASALNQEHTCKVWVIDNNSSDGTREWLQAKAKHDNRLYWWSYLMQRSLAACWNDALDRAFHSNWQRVLVLNNDVEIRPDCFHLLAEWQLLNNCPFVTGVSVGSKLELRLHAEPVSSSPHPDFSCFMLNKKCWDLVGGFDVTMYPAYCEDNDYHVRMHRAGIQAVSIDLPFVHYAAGTIKHADPAEQSVIRLGAGLNKRRFRAKYGCYPDDTKQYDKLFAPLPKARRKVKAKA